ncbi:unnamed protein product, partial [Urochloa humidicola]
CSRNLAMSCLATARSSTPVRRAAPGAPAGERRRVRMKKVDGAHRGQNGHFTHRFDTVSTGSERNGIRKSKQTRASAASGSREMGALCLLFPSTPPSCPCGAGAARSSVPVLAARPSPSSTSSAAAAATRLQVGGRSRGRAGVARVGGGGKGEGAKDAGAAAFFGEDGVVEDMDGYLNYLSLEYDSVWDTKPAW